MTERKENIVKPYQFNELIVESDTVFKKVKNPIIKDGSISNKFEEEKNEKKLKMEMVSGDKQEFSILEIVREHRGHKELAEKEHDQVVTEEVTKKVEEIRASKEKEGHDKGVKQGVTEGLEKALNQSESSLQKLDELVNSCISYKEDLLKSFKDKILHSISMITKWVILRELKDDGKYLERLLEKLILELQEQDDLLLQINENSFSDFPDIVEKIKNKLGPMSNLRIETIDKANIPGIRIESTHGIIDGTFEQQMKALDELFIDGISN